MRPFRTLDRLAFYKAIVIVTLAYWGAETLIHRYIQQDTWQEALLPSDLDNLLMRLSTLFLIAIFAYYGQRTIARLRRALGIKHWRNHREELILNSTAEGVFGIDLKGRHTFVNPAAAKMLGYSDDELIGRDSHLIWHHSHPDGSHYDERDCPFYQGQQSERPHRGEDYFWKHDSTGFPVRYTSTPLYSREKRMTGSVITFSDITEKKRQEQLLRANKEITEAFLKYRGADIYDKVLVVILRMMNSKSGAFAYIDEDGDLAVPSMTHGLWSGHQLRGNTHVFPKEEWSDHAWAVAIRDKKACFSNNPSSREAEGEFPISRHATIPIIYQEKVIGLIQVANKESDYRESHLEMLQSIADHTAPILYGIQDRDRKQKQLEDSLVKQAVLLEDTVVAISKAVEARDPYTAGHQRRVADISVAIAESMGLEDEQIKNIRLGAMIHDIGKIQTPAEILNKPTRLTEQEFALIQCHSQVGYDILSKSKVPETILDIIHHHHERMDGSGYPDGLIASQISLEAKIISVADVFEAMSSHRPYRPAKGVEKALEELKQNKNLLYDELVVDTLIALVDDDHPCCDS